MPSLRNSRDYQHAVVVVSFLFFSFHEPLGWITSILFSLCFSTSTVFCADIFPNLRQGAEVGRGREGGGPEDSMPSNTGPFLAMSAPGVLELHNQLCTNVCKSLCIKTKGPAEHEAGNGTPIVILFTILWALLISFHRLVIMSNYTHIKFLVSPRLEVSVVIRPVRPKELSRGFKKRTTDVRAECTLCQ